MQKVQKTEATEEGSSLQCALSQHSWTSPHLLKLNYCAISLVLFAAANGFDSSLINVLQSLPQWQTYLSNPTGPWLGFINIIYWIGMIFTYLFSAPISNRYGRKIGLYFGQLFILAGAILQTTAPNSAAWIAGRALAGCAAGFWSSNAPILIGETAYPTHRPVVSAFYQCGYFIGSLLAAWITFGTLSYSSSWAWRLPALLQLIIPIITIPGLLLCPESPRWMVAHHRVDEARSTLAKWHAGGDFSSPIVTIQMEEIQTSLAKEKDSASASYLDMVRTKGNRHRLLITMSLALFSQWCGVGVVAFYLTTVLENVGITSAHSRLLITACLQMWNLLCGFSAASVVGRVGKRPLFYTSAVVMLVSYILITGLSGAFTTGGNSAVGVAVIPFLFIFYAGYGIALTPLLVAYPCEIWPFNLRSRGMTLTWITSCLSASFNSLVNPIALDSIGWKYYIVFLVVLVVYGLTVHFFYPETRGYSLEQIAVIFDGEAEE